MRLNGIAMSSRIVKQYRLSNSGNRGRWLSAKIYSDMRNGCPCGGKFTAVGKMSGVEFPKCEKCDGEPTLFRIRAKILTEDNNVKYIDVRHDRGGNRLTLTYECLSVLRRVNEEMEKGTFNYRDYDSEDGRAGFIFGNYVQKYLKFHENRLKSGELSPSGFANKRTSINHLVKYFSDKDISLIKRADLENYKNSFTDRPRARDLSISELKAILNHAKDIDEMISKVPKFELVPSSKKRKEIIPIDTAWMIIDAVEDKQYQFMMELLITYPVRPGELRALQWRDVDYFGGTVTFQRHFSRDILIEGRKSVRDGEKSEVSFPLTNSFRQYLLGLPTPINKKDAFVFPGKECDFVTGKCLSNAWRKVTKKMKLPDHDMYELRHARLSQMSEQSNGNIPMLLKASGHTNVQTLTERYVRDTSDLKEFFQ